MIGITSYNSIPLIYNNQLLSYDVSYGCEGVVIIRYKAKTISN
jgi:hypothetical protein